MLSLFHGHAQACVVLADVLIFILPPCIRHTPVSFRVVDRVRRLGRQLQAGTAGQFHRLLPDRVAQRALVRAHDVVDILVLHGSVSSGSVEAERIHHDPAG